MRARKGSLASLGEVLEGLLRRAGLDHRVRQGKVMLAWKEIVGPANARHSWPLKVKDGILLVGCSSAAWAQTLTLLREQIMEKIVRLLGRCPLREIHFFGAAFPGRREEEGESAAEPLPEKLGLRVEELDFIRQLTGEISDPALRRKAEAALASLLRQRKWHQERGHRPCASCGRLHRTPGPFCPTCGRAQGVQ